MAPVSVKFRVPKRYGAFWYTDLNPKSKTFGKEVEAKGGDIVECEERVARLYGWSPEALAKEAEDLQKQAAEAAALAQSAKEAAEKAAKLAAEAKTAAAGPKKPPTPPATDPAALAQGGKA